MRFIHKHMIRFIRTVNFFVYVQNLNHRRAHGQEMHACPALPIAHGVILPPRQPPDVGHECTMHGARTYDVIPSRPGVPGGVGWGGSWPHGWVGTAVLPYWVQERERPGHARVVRPDPTSKDCLAANARARGGEQMAIGQYVGHPAGIG